MLNKARLEEMKYSVYKHIFPNGKVYIGITSKIPEERWRNGRGYLNKNRHGIYKQPKLAYAILKYGWDNVEHEILFKELTKEEAEQKEIELIKKCKSNDINFGYNIANGGNCIKTISEQTKEKLRELSKGENNGFYGKQHSKKTRNLISLKAKERYKDKTKNPMYGKKHSEKSLKKMSENRKKKYDGENNPFYGRIHSKEFIEKMTGANNHAARAVNQIDKITGEIICCFDTIKNASNATGADSSAIIRCCKDKKKSAGGYMWKYVEE